jgi:hypothetical protein
MALPDDEDGLLESARKERAKLETRRSELMDGLELVERRIKLCDRTIAEYTEAPSRTAADPEKIVAALREHASFEHPLRTPELAALMGVNGQRLARRLKKMAEEGLIVGNPEDGYYAPDF